VSERGFHLCGWKIVKAREKEVTPTEVQVEHLFFLGGRTGPFFLLWGIDVSREVSHAGMLHVVQPFCDIRIFLLEHSAKVWKGKAQSTGFHVPSLLSLKGVKAEDQGHSVTCSCTSSSPIDF